MVSMTWSSQSAKHNQNTTNRPEVAHALELMDAYIYIKNLY